MKDMIKRELTKKAKPIIAIILPKQERTDFNEYAMKLQQIIRMDGGIALVSSDDLEGSCQEKLIEYYVSYMNVDGVVIFGLKSALKKEYDIPVISLFGLDGTVTDSIAIDEETHTREIVNRLNALGHKNVAVIGEDFAAGSTEVFRKVLEDMNQTHYWFYFSTNRAWKAVEDCVEQLLCAEIRPTAIVCEYDYIAVGVIQYLKKKGYDVPKDFLVLAKYDTNLSKYTEYTFTTVDYILDDVCRQAWNILQKRMGKKNEYKR